MIKRFSTEPFVYNPRIRPQPFLIGFCVALLAATAARAELVRFANGRTMSVKGHRTDGETLVLQLRGGGEVLCASSTIARIEEDEVPYPEPPAVLSAAKVTTEGPGELAPDRRRYLDLIDRVSAQQGVDPRLVKAMVQVESGYQERARSPKGAMGLMQLMPETARQYAVANPFDPAANIEAGVRHLRSLLERFPLTLALAAYNAGEAAVQRFGGIPPYP